MALECDLIINGDGMQNYINLKTEEAPRLSPCNRPRRYRKFVANGIGESDVAH